MGCASLFCCSGGAKTASELPLRALFLKNFAFSVRTRAVRTQFAAILARSGIARASFWSAQGRCSTPKRVIFERIKPAVDRAFHAARRLALARSGSPSGRTFLASFSPKIRERKFRKKIRLFCVRPGCSNAVRSDLGAFWGRSGVVLERSGPIFEAKMRVLR